MKSIDKKIEGILAPAMVPLDESGKINEKELRRLIEWLINNGVGGFFPNGTTGEFVRFSFEERREIVRIYADQVAGRVPIIAGAAEANIDMTLSACSEYAELGCLGVAICPPYYFKLSQASLQEYYEQLAMRSELYILIYNIPQMTTELAIETIKSLCYQKKIIGIKDSSPDFARFLNLMHEIRPLREDFSFLTGRDEFLVLAMEMGADGGTNATAGVIPEVFMKMYHLARDGKYEHARKLQDEILPFLRRMLIGCEYPDGIRAGMELRGFQMGKCRQPQSGKQVEDIKVISKELDEMLKSFDEINNLQVNLLRA